MSNTHFSINFTNSNTSKLIPTPKNIKKHQKVKKLNKNKPITQQTINTIPNRNHTK